MIRKNYKDVKTILRKTKHLDYYFPALYSFSPYMGCEHGCLYCDGRSEKYYVEGVFDKDIVIRKNAVDILKAELPKKREKGTILIGSGVTDPYQPVEYNECITRSALEIIEKSGFPITILTKSKIVLRDIDVLTKINEKTPVIIMVSLTFTNDEDRKIIEPFASSVEERLNIINEAKKAGLYAGLLAMPLLPYINDDEKSVSALFNKAKEVNADFIMPSGLTLREGIQKDGYMELIRTRFPSLYEKYEWIYSEKNYSGAPRESYMKSCYPIVNKWMEELKMSQFVPFEILRKQLPLYRTIDVLFMTMRSLYNRKGIDTKRLKFASKKYSVWINQKISLYNRKRSFCYEDLEFEVLNMIEDGSINKIIENKRLSDFLYQLFIDKKQFDYVSLKVI